MTFFDLSFRRIELFCRNDFDSVGLFGIQFTSFVRVCLSACMFCFALPQLLLPKMGRLPDDKGSNPPTFAELTLTTVGFFLSNLCSVSVFCLFLAYRFLVCFVAVIAAEDGGLPNEKGSSPPTFAESTLIIVDFFVSNLCRVFVFCLFLVSRFLFCFVAVVAAEDGGAT